MPKGLKNYHMKQYKNQIDALEKKYLKDVQEVINENVFRFYCIEDYAMHIETKHTMLLYGKDKGDFIGFYYPFCAKNFLH
jgi:hypothetical protein